MAYSDTDDFVKCVPDGGTDWFFAEASFAADYAALSALASQEIDSLIGMGTATPVTDTTAKASLAEVEALLVAHRRAEALYATRDQEASELYRSQFRVRAMGILNDLIFPASATTPEELPGFVGSHGLTVEVYDGMTAGALWLVVCEAAGTHQTARFRVWNRKTDSSAPWNLAENSGIYPVRTAADDPRGESYQIRLSISESGSTAFAVGDGWTFRTYSRWKRRMRRRIRFVKNRRRGATG